MARSLAAIFFTKLRNFSGAVTFALAVLGAGSAFASSQDGIFVENGVALGGYDPVAYFTMDDAVPGSDQYTVESHGTVWYFVSQAHADLFAEMPEKYMPRYGGFCALGVSKGQQMKPDVTAWEIHDEQLYLYFNPRVAELWADDRETNAEEADTQWEIMTTEQDGS